jgi:DNA-binding LacI/PurR family transcriptional regulator
VRLIDVAREAGVSKALASRVLNGEDLPIRAETRQRILTASERLSYRPHAAARGLRRRETGALTMLIPTLTNPVWGLISQGSVSRAMERDVVVQLAEDVDAAQTNELVLRLVQAGRIDGVIVASARPRHPLLRTLLRQRIPHVFVHRAVLGTERNVIMDEQKASALAVDHLATLGHRRIAHITGPSALTTARRLAQGFTDRAALLKFESALVVNAEFSESGGAEAAAYLFARRRPPSAVYTGSVTQAFGLFHVAAELGLHLPADCSIIACGELPIAEYLTPPLTTLRLPFGELGAAAVDALVDQLSGGQPRDVLVETHPEVIVRSSTAAPRLRS